MGLGPSRLERQIRIMVGHHHRGPQLIPRFLHVYYRRTRRLDTPLISDIQVVPDPVPDALQNDLIGWTKASGDLHSGVWPTQKGAGIWYKLQEQTWAGRTRQAMTLDFSEIVTEIDIVYGDDDPFFGFTRVKGGKVLDAKPGKWDSVDLAYRRGNPGAGRSPLQQGRLGIDGSCTKSDTS